MPTAAVSPGEQVAQHARTAVRAIALLETRADVNDEMLVRTSLRVFHEVGDGFLRMSRSVLNSWLNTRRFPSDAGS